MAKPKRLFVSYSHLLDDFLGWGERGGDARWGFATGGAFCGVMKILVAGFANLLRPDDSFGVEFLRQLERRRSRFAD